jgi:ABC-2 type transport system permease protein
VLEDEAVLVLHVATLDALGRGVAMSLLKPFNYGWMVFARHVGEKIGELVSLIPVFILVFILIDINFSSMINILLFCLSLPLSFVIMFSVCYLTGLLAFWTTNSWGLHFLRKSLTFLFSGHAIAIGLFLNAANTSTLSIFNIHPDIIRTFFKIFGYLAYILPFQAMYYTPTGIFSGIIGGTAYKLLHITIQVVWILIMLFVIKFTWKKAQQKISIYGG